jgi:hypothetical protein
MLGRKRRKAAAMAHDAMERMEKRRQRDGQEVNRSDRTPWMGQQE